MTNCNCGKNTPQLIFACSGAADVGEVADRAARKLTADGAGKMFCLAGLGGKLSSFIETTSNASGVLAIDGCPANCAKNTLEQAGINDFSHIMLGDLGLVKGQTPATSEVIEKVVDSAKDILSKNIEKNKS
jgi:uncharacterized metal-binding protein